MSKKILVINPGATSTKVAVYEDDRMIFSETIRHSAEEMAEFSHIVDQYDFRKWLLVEAISKAGLAPSDMDAVVGRGGAFKPLVSGTYKINSAMLKDVEEGNVAAEHASNLGCVLAHGIASEEKLPSFIVDPVSVDEFDEVARLSGLPQLERKSLSHALNIKAVGRRAGKELGKPYDKLNLVIVHLGTGISVSAHRLGRMIDVNNANDGGPFSPQRTGSLPTTGLIKLCFSGKYSASELKRMCVGQGGMMAYLGTDDAIDVEQRALAGDEDSLFIMDAMAYQIAKEVGAMAAVLEGKHDAVVITGGIARNVALINPLMPRIEWLGKVLVYPGEDELGALAAGAFRVISGEEKAKVYK